MAGKIAGAVTILSVLCLVVVALYRNWTVRNTLVSGQGYEGVIFSGVHSAARLGPILSAEADGYWTPTEADIQALERALSASAQVGHPEGLRPLDEYRRQYFGYRRGGRAQILVVGFCDAGGAEWKHEFVSAGEGGCHFEATFDVLQDTFSSFWAFDASRRSAPGGAATGGE